MSIQEKRPIVSLISNLLIFGIYYLVVYRIYSSGNYTTEEEFKFWGAVILILVPVMIIAKIVLYIIWSIFNTIITREREPGFLKDEFGRLVESKASNNFYHVFMAGFLIAMGSIALGMSHNLMFGIFLFSILMASIMQDISQFYYSQKGL